MYHKKLNRRYLIVLIAIAVGILLTTGIVVDAFDRHPELFFPETTVETTPAREVPVIVVTEPPKVTEETAVAEYATYEQHISVPYANPKTEPKTVEMTCLETTVETTVETTAEITESEATEATTGVESSDYMDSVEMLALVIFQEAGGDTYCDECRRRVADVVLNRVADPDFPDSIYEVLTQKQQYGRLYWTGLVWADRASNPYEAHAVERAYRIAEEVLNGQHSELYGKGYIWQAEFVQGRDNIYCCGHYFGR